MRLQSLLALAATGALLLPFAAQAADPASKEGAYMEQCVQVATGKGLDAAAATAHCECGAKAIKKNFTKSEMEDLDSKDGVDDKLMQRAKTVISQACPPEEN